MMNKSDRILRILQRKRILQVVLDVLLFVFLLVGVMTITIIAKTENLNKVPPSVPVPVYPSYEENEAEVPISILPDEIGLMNRAVTSQELLNQ